MLKVLKKLTLATLLSVVPSFVTAEEPISVASINLCADQLVLLLANPDQIRSLSNLSHQEAGSFFFERARDYPVNEGHAEQILNLQPDIVIVGQYSSTYTVDMLREVGLSVKLLPLANNIESVLQNIALVAEWVGKEQQGDEIIAALRARLAQIKPPQVPRPVIAAFDPNGFTSGAATLRGEIMELAGFENAASLAGIESFGSLSLESVINLNPDAIIESPYSPDTWSRAQAMSRHPALFAAGIDPQVIYVPSRMTICGGPWTIDVLETLQAERLKLMERL